MAYQVAGRRKLPLGLVGILCAIGTVELVARAGLLPAKWFPPASTTLRKLGDLAGTSELWRAMADTLSGAGLGLAVAVLIAVPVGLLIGLSDLMYRLTRVLVEFLRPVPSVALVPLAVVLYGTQIESKMLLVAYASTWPLLINLSYGVRDTDPVALDTARAFGLGWFARLRHVIVPSTMPYAFTGLRISVAVALILSVTAELVIGSPGVGQIVVRAQSGDNAAPTIYAVTVLSGLMGLALNLAVQFAERHVLHWHQSQRGTP